VNGQPRMLGPNNSKKGNGGISNDASAVRDASHTGEKRSSDSGGGAGKMAPARGKLLSVWFARSPCTLPPSKGD